MSGIPPLPPLRIKEADGSPNVIPVFQITLSNGLTLYNNGGGKVTLDGSGSQGPAGPAGTVTIGSSITGGATPGYLLIVSDGSVIGQIDSGTFQRAIAFPISTGSGGTGRTTIGSAHTILGVNSSEASLSYYAILGSNNVSVVKSGTSIIVSALTANISGKQDSISFPLIVGSGGSGLQTAGSGTRLIGMDTSGGVNDYYLLLGSNNASVTRSGTAYYISATTNPGGGAGSVSSGTIGRIAYYPQTGTNVDDLTIGSAHTILGVNSSEASYTHYLLLASDNASIIKSGTGIFFSAVTAPSVGGNGASTANTYVVMDFTTDLSNEFRLIQSGNSVTVDTSNSMIVINALTQNITGKQDLIAIPLITGSGGTGRTTVGSAHTVLGVNSDGTTLSYYAILASNNTTVTKVGTGIYISADTGAGGGAPTNAEYVTYAGNGSLSNEKILTAGSSVTIVTDATAIYINAITNPAGAGGAKTVRIPMSVLTVKVNSANAFYVAKSGIQMDEAHMTFVDSGLGVATYWCEVPYNISATANWSLVIRHEPDSGAGGNVALTVCAKAVSDGSYMDVGTTVILSARSIATYSADTLALSAVGTGVFDNTMGLAQNQLLYVIFQRLGNNAGDTVNANWNLKSLSLQCDVT